MARNNCGTAFSETSPQKAETPHDLKKDFAALLNLQIITEKLLYQLEIPSEISEKFQMLKMGTYAAIGIDPSDPFASLSSRIDLQHSRLGRSVSPPHSPISLEDKMVFYNITMKKFVDYLHDLTMSVSLRSKTLEGNHAHQTLPVFRAMPLGNWAEMNEKLNDLQEDFASRTQSLVHAIMTERKIHETIELDFHAAKARNEQLESEILHLQEALQANSAKDRSKWQQDSTYMRLIKDRILKAAQSRHASYLKAFISEKGVSEEHHAFDSIELTLYICRRLQTDNDWLVDKLAQVERQRAADEEIWAQRLKHESEKNQRCESCEIISNRINILAREVPSAQQLTDYKSALQEFYALSG